MAGMITRVQDPLLRQAIANVEKTLHPNMQQNYEAAVVSCMKVAWSEKFGADREQALALINTPQNVPQVVAKAAVKVLSLVQNEVSGDEPIPSAGPAGIVIMAQMLEFVEKKKGIDITKDILDQCTYLTYQGIFALYGISKESLDAVQKNGGKQPPAPPTPAASPTQPNAAPAQPTAPVGG